MSTILKQDDFIISRGRAIVSKNLKSYKNDPYFVKKAEKAIEFLQNVKFSTYLLTK